MNNIDEFWIDAFELAEGIKAKKGYDQFIYTHCAILNEDLSEEHFVVFCFFKGSEQKKEMWLKKPTKVICY